MQRMSSILESNLGSAAAEMALVTPLLLTLMFGSFELGNYFLDEHALAKGVRDGARFAARLSVNEYYSGNTCVSGTYAGTKRTSIQNVTSTGSVDGSALPRIGYWNSTYSTPPSTAITITIACVSKSTYPGIYSTLIGDIPVVTVQADVRYLSLFQRLGFDSSNLHLRAQAQSAVMGI